MKIRGICRVGVKTRDCSQLAKFFRQVMGLSHATERTNFAGFGLPHDDKFEVFGPKGPDPPNCSEQAQLFAGFLSRASKRHEAN
jgi:hypothetical protein